MAVKNRPDDYERRMRDLVFRALGDETRRKILDIVRERPGIPLSDLFEHFPVSRFAIMKHLTVLEAAWLVRREREGAIKRLRLDREPLQHAREWLRSFE